MVDEVDISKREFDVFCRSVREFHPTTFIYVINNPPLQDEPLQHTRFVSLTIQNAPSKVLFWLLRSWRLTSIVLIKNCVSQKRNFCPFSLSPQMVCQKKCQKKLSWRWRACSRLPNRRSLVPPETSKNSRYLSIKVSLPVELRASGFMHYSQQRRRRVGFFTC